MLNFDTSAIERRLGRVGLDEAWPLGTLATLNATMDPYRGRYRAQVRTALRTFVKASEPIIEVGCGLGYLGTLLPPEYKKGYLQSDIGAAACAQASKRNTALATAAFNARTMPFADASIGAIVGLNTIDAMDDMALAPELHRVLRPGGTFLHLHAVRPNLPWLAERFDPKGRLVMPYVNRNNALVGFQLISPKDFRTLLSPGLRQLALYVADPYRLDLLRTGYLGEEGYNVVREVSDKVYLTGRATKTQAFQELLADRIRKTFGAHGLALDVDGMLGSPFSGPGTMNLLVARRT